MMTVRPLKRSSEVHNYNKLDKSKVQPYCILEQLKPRQNKPQYVHIYTHTHRGMSRICRSKATTTKEQQRKNHPTLLSQILNLANVLIFLELLFFRSL